MFSVHHLLKSVVFVKNASALLRFLTRVNVSKESRVAKYIFVSECFY